VQIIDTVETFRDLLQGMLDVYMSTISNRLNEVMKVLTIISTIFIPLNFIAGVYGMNFRHMPELDKVWGYPLALGFMALVAGVMVILFHKRGWF
jgi:magnesium transporter